MIFFDNASPMPVSCLRSSSLALLMSSCFFIGLPAPPLASGLSLLVGALVDLVSDLVLVSAVLVADFVAPMALLLSDFAADLVMPVVALVALLGKLDQYRFQSRFTTWAYKFAILEAAVLCRRRAWQERELPTDPQPWGALTSIALDPADEQESSRMVRGRQKQPPAR